MVTTGSTPVAGFIERPTPDRDVPGTAATQKMLRIKRAQRIVLEAAS